MQPEQAPCAAASAGGFPRTHKLTLTEDDEARTPAKRRRAGSILPLPWIDAVQYQHVGSSVVRTVIFSNRRQAAWPSRNWMLPPAGRRPFMCGGCPRSRKLIETEKSLSPLDRLASAASSRSEAFG